MLTGAGMRINQDIAGGVLLMAIGLFALIYAQRWEFGAIARIGPAFFPVVLAVTLMGIGILMVVIGLKANRVDISVNPRALIAISLGVGVFALILRPAGLVPSAFLITIVVSLADPELPWLTRFVLAGLVTVFVCAVFVFGLGMNLPLWRIT